MELGTSEIASSFFAMPMRSASSSACVNAWFIFFAHVVFQSLAALWFGHWPVRGHLGYFQCLFLTDRVPMDAHKQAFVWTYFSLFQISTQEARLCVSHAFDKMIAELCS